MAEAYEVFYVDEHGAEVELGTFIEEPMEAEQLRERIKAWIARFHGDEEARKWIYHGPRYRQV